MPDHSPTALALTYQKRPSFHRRRRFRRSVLLVVMVGIAAAIWHWHEPIWFRGQVLYWQHRCLTYTAPEGQIVGMFDRPGVMTALAKTDAGYTADLHYVTSGEPDFIRRTSGVWDKYRLLVGAPETALYVGMESYSLEKWPWLGAVPPVRVGPTVAFMHERANLQGEKRLVAVFLSQEGSQTVEWQFSAYCYRPSNFPEKNRGNWSGGVAIARDYRNAENTGESFVDAAKFFAGQYDGNDASRFSMRFELDGVGGVIDGQLLDGDKVKMTVRDGPASKPGRSWTITPRADDAL